MLPVLSGLRVIAVEQYGAGPYGSMQLADLGAEVSKIENPAEAGYMSLAGEPDGPPARMGLTIVDLMTGHFAAFALVSGVLAARETGRGRDLDVSLFDAALQNLVYLATWYLNAGHVQRREPRS